MHVLTGLPSRRYPIGSLSTSETAKSFEDKALQSLILAIGNFDGVHLGHKALIDTCTEIAKTLPTQLPACSYKVGVLTFSPHPRRFFTPDVQPFLLTTLANKAQHLQKIGADEVIVLPFSHELASMSALDFVTDLIAYGLSPAHVVIGHDFHFGKGRSGTPELMSEWLAAHDIGCSIVAPQADNVGALHSSSAVRKALTVGDLKTANASLVFPWSVSGQIVKGDQIGRILGFPTANIHIPEELVRLRYGVYAATCQLSGSTTELQGAVSFGMRPAINGTQERFEVHLLDFNDDVYNQILTVRPIAFLRPEWNFDTLEALKQQIEQDVHHIRQTLLRPSL